jgi:ABC-type transport system involved in multi-copper enzyme maturation permease subunit
MNKILTIALNTYRESIRNKVFYIIVVFAMFLLSCSLILATLALGEDDRIIKHVGLSAINIFGLLMAIFVGVNLVYDELEKRTVYTIIASGVKRYEFLFGKFLGLFFTVGVNILIMGFMLCLLVVAWPECTLSATLVLAILLFLMEMLVISAIAILFSSFSTPILSAVLTVMCCVIGHMSEDLLEWSQRLGEQGSALFSKFLMVMYYILPNLELFNLKNQVIYSEDIGSIGHHFITYPVYAVVYSGILMIIAILSFSRRDFK